MSSHGKRLIKSAKEMREPGFESSAAIRTIDTIARAICSANCAYRGVTPCWSVHTDRSDAMEWPNPLCNEPGCHSIATDVYQQVTPGRGKRG